MYFFQPSEVEPREIAPGARIRTFWGERIMISLVDLDAQSTVPIHKHPHEQAGIVLEGELRLTIAGEERRLHKGDIYVIPSDVEHGVTQADRAAAVADLFSPPREDYKR